MISGAFESPVVKRGQLQITRSNQVKEFLKMDDSSYRKNMN